MMFARALRTLSEKIPVDIHADLSHDPGDIAGLVELILDDVADLVLGS